MAENKCWLVSSWLFFLFSLSLNRFIEIQFTCLVFHQCDCTAQLFLVNFCACAAITTTHCKTLVTPHNSVCRLAASRAPTPAPSNLICFLSLQLCLLEISYTWNHILCGFLCLFFFSQHDVFEVHLCCCTYQEVCPFFLLCSTFHCPLIHSSADGCLGGFPI